MKQSAAKRLILGVPFILYLMLQIWSWSILGGEQTGPVDHHVVTAAQPKPRNPLEDLSSVDYFACCGLGHRLIRMSLAGYIAKQRNFSLRAFWGWCGEQNPIEVFSYLFRPYEPSEVAHVSSRGLLIPFYNEVSGFQAVVRKPTSNLTECACHQDKIESDYELYNSLRERFRGKRAVDKFVREFFSEKTVLGVHVRAGNGEGGDFVRKGRSIEKPSDWVNEVCKLLIDYVQQQTLWKPPLLYVATDTPSIISLFRNSLTDANIPVLELPQQERPAAGQGVLFGESDKVRNKGGEKDDFSSCLKGWTDTMTDMFLLSHADVVIAGKPSSFSQTLPMSLAFGNANRKLGDAYCEVIPQHSPILVHNDTVWEEVAPRMTCYQSYVDWCCNHSTWIKFHHVGPQGHVKTISKEFVKFLPLDKVGSIRERDAKSMRRRAPDCRRPRRGRSGGGLKDKCLPHEW